MRMSLPAHSAAVPPTVKVKVSQVIPSWHNSSPLINPSGALRDPPPGAVPTQVIGVVAVALMVAPAGLDAEVLLSPGSAGASSAARKVKAIKPRDASRHEC